MSVRVKKTRQNKRWSAGSESIRTKKFSRPSRRALGVGVVQDVDCSYKLTLSLTPGPWLRRVFRIHHTIAQRNCIHLGANMAPRVAPEGGAADGQTKEREQEKCPGSKSFPRPRSSIPSARRYWLGIRLTRRHKRSPGCASRRPCAELWRPGRSLRPDPAIKPPRLKSSIAGPAATTRPSSRTTACCAKGNAARALLGQKNCQARREQFRQRGVELRSPPGRNQRPVSTERTAVSGFRPPRLRPKVSTPLSSQSPATAFRAKFSQASLQSPNK